MGDEAKFRFYDGGYGSFQITELTKNERLEWLCVDNDEKEWIGTRVRFEIESLDFMKEYAKHPR